MNTHTYTHTYIYIYAYFFFVYVFICWASRICKLVTVIEDDTNTTFSIATTPR